MSFARESYEMSKVMEESYAMAKERLSRQLEDWAKKYAGLVTDSPAAALSLIDQLRVRGVRSFEGMGIKVDLVPPAELPKEWLDLMMTPTVVVSK